MANNIKVTVSYETPNTSEFDALFVQYKIAKEIADKTERDLVPVINEVGKAKYDAICEQLQVIANQVKQLNEISGQYYVGIMAVFYINSQGYYLEIGSARDRDVTIQYKTTKCCDYYKDFLDYEKYKTELIANNGIVTNWNNLNVIEKLQEKIKDKMLSIINTQIKKAETLESTLNKM